MRTCRSLKLLNIDNILQWGIGNVLKLLCAKFEDHISMKVKTTNSIVGQMRRSFSYLDCDTFKRIFVAFVRPHLEYGEAVWSPHLIRNITALENVQIRATKLVDGLANLTYPERLKRLELPSLVFRRRRGDLIEMYKHFHTYFTKYAMHR